MDSILAQIAQSSMAASAVQAIEQAVLNANNMSSSLPTPAEPSTSSTNSTNTHASASLSSLTMLSSISNIWALVLSYPALRDGAKLFILGGAIEIARRALMYAWTSFLESFFITAEFAEGDETYMWMMFWLSKQPKWNKARSVRVSTSRYGHSGTADMLPGEEDETGTIDPKRRLQYTPLHNTTHYMWFKGAWLSITRSKTQGDWWNRGDERLTVTMFTRNQKMLDVLLLEAKRAYKADAEGRINIWVADQYNDWSLAGSRPKRPLSSVVLDQGIKERLLVDAKDFMSNEKWYAARGIPWRRGYLLHGHPGTGKTSLIHALAGELDLDIYIISLSKKGLDDSSLNELISRLPSKSLALMEDIDAAFFRGVTREVTSSSDQNANGAPNGTGPDGSSGNSNSSGSHEQGGPPGGPPSQQASPSTGVTLSGLLGAIDGVAAQEGRLLFATTNKYKSLDPALIRPGRLDVHVQFDLAGKWQIEELFKCFFPPTLDPDVDGSEVKANPDGDDDDKTLVEGSLTPPVSASSGSGSGSGSSSPESSLTYNDFNPCVHCPLLSIKQVDQLSKTFAERVPDREFSMAAIQGLLMQYKTTPYLAVEEAVKWVEAERKKKAEREGTKVVRTEVKEEQKKESVQGDGVQGPSWFSAFGVI